MAGNTYIPKSVRSYHGTSANEAPGAEKNPKLVIPYYEGDVGDGASNGKRMLPGNIPSYLCSAIRINGLVYDGTPLTRDEPVSVTVDVSNLGNDDTEAMVSLFWSEPTPVFQQQSLHIDEFSEPVFVYIPAAGKVTSPIISFIPKSSVQFVHICLLAEVTAVSDPSPQTYDPFERHYAQHNVTLAEVKPGKLGTFQFYAGNPFDTEAIASVRLRSSSMEQLTFLKQFYHVQPKELSDEALSLQSVKDAEGQQELLLDLGPGERLLCQGFILTDGLEQGQFTAAEVQQSVRRRGDDRATENERNGSLGIVIFPVLK